MTSVDSKVHIAIWYFPIMIAAARDVWRWEQGVGVVAFPDAHLQTHASLQEGEVADSKPTRPNNLVAPPMSLDLLRLQTVLHILFDDV